MSFTTLTQAMTALNGLIEKSDGDLIKAQEWNDLVNGVLRIGADLQDLATRVTQVETYVGYQAGYSGDNLTQRLEALAGYVGQAGAGPGSATLSARVAALEAADNVTQTEFDTLENSIHPLLEQYIVKFQSDEADYLLGDTATVTATVRTLTGAVPQGQPWIDFIATWGRLKAAPGFEVREGTGLRSMAVRANAQGVARVLVTAEQNKGLSLEEEAEVSQFFQMELPGEPIRFKEAVKKAPTTQSEYMDKCYKTVSIEYQSNRKAVQKLTDDYYRESMVGSYWTQAQPENRWKKYRATVIGFAKNDADPTTPDYSRGASSIQLLFQDWIGPWVDGYLDIAEDDPQVGIWEGNLGRWVEMNRYDFLDHVEEEVDDLLHRGPIERERGLRAMGRAAEKINEKIVDDPDEWIMDVVQYAAGTQRMMNIFQDIPGPNAAQGAGGQAMKVVFAQSRQVNAADQRAAQAKNEVLASAEFGNLRQAVGTLQNSTTAIGKNVMGALQDIEHKVVNINAFDSAALQTSVNEIKAKIGVARNLVPDR
ncbi:MAG: hypothetical protein M0036_15325 [Desulfobacteraceae bacterium]|nr:hypothetical protein [Desulfobacteraceae bacterium]